MAPQSITGTRTRQCYLRLVSDEGFFTFVAEANCTVQDGIVRATLPLDKDSLCMNVEDLTIGSNAYSVRVQTTSSNCVSATGTWSLAGELHRSPEIVPMHEAEHTVDATIEAIITGPIGSSSPTSTTVKTPMVVLVKNRLGDE